MNGNIHVRILPNGDAKISFVKPPSVTVGKRERKELARTIVDIALEERQSTTFYGKDYYVIVVDMPTFDGVRYLHLMFGEGDGTLWSPAWRHDVQLSIEEAFELAGALVSNTVIV